MRPVARPEAAASRDGGLEPGERLSELRPPETVAHPEPPAHCLLILAALSFLPSPGGLVNAIGGPAFHGERQGSRRPLPPPD
ncbi:hypothetical protein NDU88_001205 [Pleurodeles waltl]|uniref:Uncharacterized protein n=1 Tax=Pleurodeles waltl TaxID=8319 RepID=A0AAV7M4L9_PLEWA|nr:hypothetical protein NDU88_001205 [Pleurodeles waltl]